MVMTQNLEENGNRKQAVVKCDQEEPKFNCATKFYLLITTEPRLGCSARHVRRRITQLRRRTQEGCRSMRG